MVQYWVGTADDSAKSWISGLPVNQYCTQSFSVVVENNRCNTSLSRHLQYMGFKRCCTRAVLKGLYSVATNHELC